MVAMLLQSLHSSLQKFGISGGYSPAQLNCWMPSSKAASRAENQRKDLLLGLPYIHSTWPANQFRSHLHILHLRTLEGPWCFTQTSHFILEDNESQMKRKDIFQVTWYDLGLPIPTVEPTLTTSRYAMCLDEFWLLKCDTYMTKLNCPRMEVGRSGQCCVAKASQHKTGAYFPSMGHITATLAKITGISILLMHHTVERNEASAIHSATLSTEYGDD